MASDRSQVHKLLKECGEFIRLENMEEILTRLDQIEGFDGYGQSGSLFSRRLTDVHVGEGRVRTAWTYVKEPPQFGEVIASGCWREHHGVRERFLETLGMVHATGKIDIIDVLFSWEWTPKSDPRKKFPRNVGQLGRALIDETISERRLAKASGIWAACCKGDR